MKVIVAGFSKTGTKTMNEVLSLLGYKTYDFLEHWWFHGNEWIKILNRGGTTNDFYEMYKDVDAVVDAPAFLFWEEIHRAFPDAKIILTVRDEDKWYKSHVSQVVDNFEIKLRALRYTAASTRLNPVSIIRFFKYLSATFRVVFSSEMYNTNVNEMLSRMVYRRHNAYVMQAAPKSKLLVYNVSEGWGPLCHFLEKDMPNVPFPHKNKNSTAADEILAENPIAIENVRITKNRCLIFLFLVLSTFLAVIMALFLKPF